MTVSSWSLGSEPQGPSAISHGGSLWAYVWSASFLVLVYWRPCIWLFGVSFLPRPISILLASLFLFPRKQVSLASSVLFALAVRQGMGGEPG